MKLEQTNDSRDLRCEDLVTRTFDIMQRFLRYERFYFAERLESKRTKRRKSCHLGDVAVDNVSMSRLIKKSQRWVSIINNLEASITKNSLRKTKTEETSVPIQKPVQTFPSQVLSRSEAYSNQIFGFNGAWSSDGKNPADQLDVSVRNFWELVERTSSQCSFYQGALTTVRATIKKKSPLRRGRSADGSFEDAPFGPRKRLREEHPSFRSTDSRPLIRTEQ